MSNWLLCRSPSSTPFTPASSGSTLYARATGSYLLMVLEDLDPCLLLGCTTAETRERFFIEFRRALRRLLDGPHPWPVASPPKPVPPPLTAHHGEHSPVRETQ